MSSVEKLPRLNLDAEGAFEIDWTRFDAATHIVGPEEKLLRRLEWFTFVTHVPADYFEGEAI